MRWPYIISSVALIGAGLLLFFNILCGASTSTPLNEWYWLEAQTESIPGAQANTRWTNYNSCGVSNGKNVDCSSSSAAYPMSPVSNFGTTEGVPPGLQSKHGVTYYLSKVGWAFLLIGLLFTLLALIPNLVALCLPSQIALTTISGVVPALALLFTALSASLITAGYVKARNAFRDAGSHTSLGRTMIAFIWTSVFLLALSTAFSGVGCFSNFKRKKRDKRYSTNNEASSHDTYGNDYAGEKVKKKRGGFFTKRQKGERIEDAGYAAGFNVSRDAGVTTVPNTTAATTGDGPGTQAKSTSGGNAIKDAAYAASVGASGATSNYTKGGAGTTAAVTAGVTAALIGAVSAAAGGGDHEQPVDSGVALGSAEYSKDSKVLDTFKDTNPDSAANASGAISGYNNKGVDKNTDTANNKKTNSYHFDRNGAVSSTDAYGSRNADFIGSESKPYDAEAATGYESQGEDSKLTGKATNKYANALESGASENKDIWTSAAGFLGIGGAAATSAAHDLEITDPDIYEAVHSEVDPRNTDVGAGATHAGANADKDLKKHRNEFENKSTTLPVQNNKYTIRDQYGGEKDGHQRSVSETLASSRKPYRPVKEGAAVSAEETYSGSHIGSRNKKDLTDTSGYEPTNYYNRKTSNEFNRYPAESQNKNLNQSALGSAVLTSSEHKKTNNTDLSPGYETLKKSKSADYEKTSGSFGYGKSYKFGCDDDNSVKYRTESKNGISPVAATLAGLTSSNLNAASDYVEGTSGSVSNSGAKVESFVSQNGLEGSHGDNTGNESGSRITNIGFVENDDLPGAFGNGQYGVGESSYTTTRLGADKYSDEDSIPRAFREQYKDVAQQGTTSKDSAGIINEIIEGARSVI